MGLSLVSPCGIYCVLCVAYHGYTMSGKKRKHTCPGCRIYDKTCAFLKRDCELLKEESVDFCYQCQKFPCDNFLKLDQRYKKKYETSLIDNLLEIKDEGVESFIQAQLEKYTCPECGENICMHTNKCYNCEYQR
jgi:hypothetical protein